MIRLCSHRPSWLCLVFLLSFAGSAFLLFVDAAQAFQILSPKSEPCHEKLMLGALGLEEIPFRPSQSNLRGLVSQLAAQAQGSVPQDNATQGLIREVTKRHRLESLSEEERFVVASFIVGVREPDTHGFAIVDLNEVRSIHIQDKDQSAHALRRSTQDGKNGDAEAIQEAKDRVRDLGQQVVSTMARVAPVISRARWTFAFYGETEVMVLTPALLMGQISHLIQDSYSHLIRDSELKVLSVMNYVDVINENLDEARDGHGHSERLDHCDPNDAFDALRMQAAGASTVRLLQPLTEMANAQARGIRMTQATSPETEFETNLEVMFERREGCDLQNQYCGSEWYTKALESTTAPHSLAVCGSSYRTPHDQDHPPSSNARLSLFFGFFMILVTWLWLRLRDKTKVGVDVGVGFVENC